MPEKTRKVDRIGTTRNRVTSVQTERKTHRQTDRHVHRETDKEDTKGERLRCKNRKRWRDIHGNKHRRKIGI